MTSLTRQLYIFMTACGGNWRNTIFITCRHEPEHPGYLLAVDRDGCPVIMNAVEFHYLTGVLTLPSAAERFPKHPSNLCSPSICL